jgi:hypothetical protein
VTDSVVVGLYRDVKMGRKTSEEAASVLLDKYSFGDRQFQDALVEGHPDPNDNIGEDIPIFDYDSVEDKGFWGGLFAIFRNVGTLLLNAVMILAKVVVLPRDVIVAVKEVARTSKNVKGGDIQEFYGAMKEFISTGFDAAVSLDKGEELLFESLQDLNHSSF